MCHKPQCYSTGLIIFHECCCFQAIQTINLLWTVQQSQFSGYLLANHRPSLQLPHSCSQAESSLSAVCSQLQLLKHADYIEETSCCSIHLRNTPLTAQASIVVWWFKKICPQGFISVENPLCLGRTADVRGLKFRIWRLMFSPGNAMRSYCVLLAMAHAGL